MRGIYYGLCLNCRGPISDERLLQFGICKKCLEETERKSLGIETLPASLKEALEEWESDDICIKALGKETAEKYLELKLEEWREYEKNGNSKSITAWEVQRYLYM